MCILVNIGLCMCVNRSLCVFLSLSLSLSLAQIRRAPALPSDIDPKTVQAATESVIPDAAVVFLGLQVLIPDMVRGMAHLQEQHMVVVDPNGQVNIPGWPRYIPYALILLLFFPFFCC